MTPSDPVVQGRRHPSDRDAAPDRSGRMPDPPARTIAIPAGGTVLDLNRETAPTWRLSLQVLQGLFFSYALLPGGERQICRILFPGDVLEPWNAAIPVSVEALTPGRVRRRLRSAPGGDQDDHWQILGPAVIEDMRWTAALSRFSTGHRADTRLAGLLLFLRAEVARRSLPIDPIRLPLSQAGFGDMIGLCPETVCRTLAEFRHKGLVDVSRPDLRFRDLEGLRRIAQGRFRRPGS